MDEEKVAKFLRTFIKRHRITFHRISYSQTQTLELALAASAAEHYSLEGYSLQTINPSGSTFVVKTTARGHPAKYSRFFAEKDGKSIEIHMNLMVRSHHDRGIYCVDLAITEDSIVPDHPRAPWECLENSHLYSFAEAKKLVVFPMLIAQFIGIVHEIQPGFLASPDLKKFLSDGHFPPTLVSLGSFSGNAKSIIDEFPKRGLAIQVIPGFDLKLARLRVGIKNSPFNEYREMLRATRRHSTTIALAPNPSPDRVKSRDGSVEFRD